MSELRQDRTSGTWSIIAPSRGNRPHDRFHDTARDAKIDPSECPFCPGRETQLPEVVAEIGQDAAPGWRVRAVPNLYPAVDAGEGTVVAGVAGARAEIGYGRHEVIIDSPRHGADLSDLDGPQIEAVVSMYHRRYRALAAMPRIETVVLCRNHGHRAGASLNHPHTQIIALAMVPQRIRAACAWQRAAHLDTGQCVTCREIAAELDDGRRIVEETEHFVAHVPFAAAAPFETWLAPKRHHSSFGAIGPEERADLARLLRQSIRRLKDAAGASVAYNLVVESWATAPSSLPHLHWKLRLIPAIVVPGGFELGTSLPINPSLPEADAEALRSVTVEA